MGEGGWRRTLASLGLCLARGWRWCFGVLLGGHMKPEAELWLPGESPGYRGSPVKGRRTWLRDGTLKSISRKVVL